MAGEAMTAFVRFFVKDDVSDEARAIEQRAKEAAEAMDKAADSSGNGLAGGLHKMAGAAKTGMTALAGVGAGAAAFVGGILGLSAATGDFQEDMGKLETAFTTQGHSIETAKGVYNDFVGLLGETDQAVEAANHLAELTSSTEELTAWNGIAAGVYAKFGDSLPLEGLTEAANETAKVGQVTGPFADTLNWATMSAEQWNTALGDGSEASKAFAAATAEGMSAEDAFNAALATTTSEQERASMITAALTGLYGEAGAKYQEVNADLIASRQAQSDWNAAMTEAGNAVRPIATELMGLGTSILVGAMPYLQQFAGWFQEKMPIIKQTLSDAFTYVTENVLPPLQEGFNFLKDTVLPPLQTAFQWFIDNLPTIIPIVAGLVAAMIAFQATLAIQAAISAISAAIAAFKLALDGATISQKLLNLAMKMNPIAIVVSLIVGLIAILVTAYNTNEDFRNIVNGVWETVKGAIGGAIDGIKGFISDLIAKFQEIWNKAIEIKDGIVNTFNGIKDGIGNAINTAKDVVTGAIDTIKGAFNFSWSLPHINLPHFRVSGGEAPWGFGGKGSLPSIGIDWYAKGGVFDEPTLFNTASGFKGVGEAGPEAVAPIGVLQKYIAEAVGAAMGNAGGYVANINVTTGETDESKLARMIAREQKRQAYALGAI